MSEAGEKVVLRKDHDLERICMLRAALYRRERAGGRAPMVWLVEMGDLASRRTGAPLRPLTPEEKGRPGEQEVRSRAENELNLKKEIIREHNLQLIQSLRERFGELLDSLLTIPEDTSIDGVLGIFINRTFNAGERRGRDDATKALAGFLVEKWGHLPGCEEVTVDKDVSLTELVGYFMVGAIKRGQEMGRSELVVQQSRQEGKTEQLRQEAAANLKGYLRDCGLDREWVGVQLRNLADEKIFTPDVKRQVCEELRVVLVGKLRKAGCPPYGNTIRAVNRVFKSICGEETETKGEEGKDETNE